MKVYRYLSQWELCAILTGNMSIVGHKYNNDAFKDVNSHRYKKNEKYLHFFADKKDMRLIKKVDFLRDADYYECEFDIPWYVLIKGMGLGYYEGSGYNDEIAVEYKVPTRYLKKEYLVSYTLDSERKHKMNESLQSLGDNNNLENFDINR